MHQPTGHLSEDELDDVNGGTAIVGSPPSPPAGPMPIPYPNVTAFPFTVASSAVLFAPNPK